MVDFAGSPLRPRWVYTDSDGAVDYLMSTPQRPWNFGSLGLGGSDISAAGVPAAFEIRRDHLLHLTLRFPESEWDDVERLVRHLQRAGSATFYPDQDDTSVAHTVYGDSPKLGEDIEPRRSGFPAILELDISVRRTTDAVFTDPYYGDLLFHWQAGTRADGMVFTRSGAIGSFVDKDGVLVQGVAANVERTEWLDLDGDGIFETPTLLLEDERTNGFTRSEELDNSVWVKTRSSISANDTTAPDGTATADKLVEDGTAASTHIIGRSTPTLTDDTDQSYTFFAKAAERTEVRARIKGKDNVNRTVWFDLSAGTVGTTSNATGRITALANGWYRCEIVADSNNGGTTPDVSIAMGSGSETVTYNGDGASGLHLWGKDFETDQPFASSYIQTVGSTVTRNAELCRFPFDPKPRALTLYVSIIERGTVESVDFTRLVQISAATDGQPVLELDNTNVGRYRIRHDNDIDDQAIVTAAIAASIGNTVELRGVLAASGAVLLGQAINGAAEVVTSQTSAPASGLAQQWDADPFINVNSAGASAIGFGAFRSIKIARDAPTMGQLRVMFS